jgi:hypothetical protein
VDERTPFGIMEEWNDGRMGKKGRKQNDLGFYSTPLLHFSNTPFFGTSGWCKDQ